MMLTVDSLFTILWLRNLLLFTTKGVAQVLIYFASKAAVVSYNVHANRKLMYQTWS